MHDMGRHLVSLKELLLHESDTCRENSTQVHTYTTLDRKLLATSLVSVIKLHVHIHFCWEHGICLVILCVNTIFTEEGELHKLTCEDTHFGLYTHVVRLTKYQLSFLRTHF